MTTHCPPPPTALSGDDHVLAAVLRRIVTEAWVDLRVHQSDEPPGASLRINTAVELTPSELQAFIRNGPDRWRFECRT